MKQGTEVEVSLGGVAIFNSVDRESLIEKTMLKKGLEGYGGVTHLDSRPRTLQAVVMALVYSRNTKEAKEYIVCTGGTRIRSHKDRSCNWGLPGSHQAGVGMGLAPASARLLLAGW